MITLSLVVILLIHYGTCLFYFFNIGEDIKGVVLGLENSNFGENYLISSYFIITTLSTTGFGDIVANNKPTIILTMILEITGSIVLGFLISILSSLFSSTNRALLSYSEFLSNVKSFSRQAIQKSSSYQLLQEANYYRTSAKSKSLIGWNEIKLIVSPDFAETLALEFSSTIQISDYLRDKDESFISKLFVQGTVIKHRHTILYITSIY